MNKLITATLLVHTALATNDPDPTDVKVGCFFGTEAAYRKAVTDSYEGDDAYKARLEQAENRYQHRLAVQRGEVQMPPIQELDPKHRHGYSREFHQKRQQDHEKYWKHEFPTQESRKPPPQGI